MPSIVFKIIIPQSIYFYTRPLYHKGVLKMSVFEFLTFSEVAKVNDKLDEMN